MEAKDKSEFAKELTLTIQCVSGTIHPPTSMLKAYWETLQDLPVDKVILALQTWRKRETTWPSPAAIRTAIVGRPEQDTFDEYLDFYVSRGRTGKYDHPIGLRVVKALGGSQAFARMNTFDRAEWKRKWTRIYREIENDERPEPRAVDAEVSTEPRRVQ